jgi:hypothetical protein
MDPRRAVDEMTKASSFTKDDHSSSAKKQLLVIPKLPQGKIPIS